MISEEKWKAIIDYLTEHGETDKESSDDDLMEIVSVDMTKFCEFLAGLKDD